VFAVQTDDVATPLELVVSVSVAVLFANKQLAPEDGAVNVTVAPLEGFPFEVTVACNVANAFPTCTLCGVPLVAEMAMVGAGFELELLHATKAEIMPRPTKRRRDLRNVIAHLRSAQFAQPFGSPGERRDSQTIAPGTHSYFAP
jgi:hypothetical protein